MANWKISEFGWFGITGVYCLCDDTGVLYVGSSKNIGKRLLNVNHHYRKFFENDHPVYIKYRETSDYLNLEKALIKRLKPSLNKRHNNG